MSPAQYPISAYVEVGKRRTFAGAVDWPGWCRSGRDERAALEALLACGLRYASALAAVHLDFVPPTAVSALAVGERLAGNSTTDFGAPAAVPAADERPIEPQELDRLAAILKASWLAFDGAEEAAKGRDLRKGPRGGGRELASIVQHVNEANRAYLAKLAWKPAKDPDASPAALMVRMLDECLKALAAAAAGELPNRGPRGGKLWLPRYFVRRAAWHVLDHAWEIEDRVEEPP